MIALVCVIYGCWDPPPPASVSPFSFSPLCCSFSSSSICCLFLAPPVPFCVSHLQVGGQCRCKAAVTGRQCSDCVPGWHSLQASNPKGCVRCNCSDIGTVSTPRLGGPSCDQHTGQCECKPHVTGKHNVPVAVIGENSF